MGLGGDFATTKRNVAIEVSGANVPGGKANAASTFKPRLSNALRIERPEKNEGETTYIPTPRSDNLAADAASIKWPSSSLISIGSPFRPLSISDSLERTPKGRQLKTTSTDSSAFISRSSGRPSCHFTLGSKFCARSLSAALVVNATHLWGDSALCPIANIAPTPAQGSKRTRAERPASSLETTSIRKVGKLRRIEFASSITRRTCVTNSGS